MGIKISDSRSFKLEPVTKNRFLFQFSAVPGSNGQEEALAFVAKSAGIPEMSFEPVKIKRMNETYNTAGNMSWNPISLTFNDYIRNSNNNGENSAGDIMYDWACMIYNPLTGQQGYKTQYATSATEAQLDPAGNIFRAWNLFGCWPNKVSFGGELSYDSAEVNTINVDLIYDLAIKVRDSKSSSESA